MDDNLEAVLHTEPKETLKETVEVIERKDFVSVEKPPRKKRSDAGQLGERMAKARLARKDFNGKISELQEKLKKDLDSGQDLSTEFKKEDQLETFKENFVSKKDILKESFSLKDDALRKGRSTNDFYVQIDYDKFLKSDLYKSLKGMNKFNL